MSADDDDNNVFANVRWAAGADEITEEQSQELYDDFGCYLHSDGSIVSTTDHNRVAFMLLVNHEGKLMLRNRAPIAYLIHSLRQVADQMEMDAISQGMGRELLGEDEEEEPE